MTSIPASRSARAMILAPRSWPSRPGLATTTRSRVVAGRSLVALTVCSLEDRCLAVGAEDLLQRGDGLALGGVGASALQQRRHQVAVRLGSRLLELTQQPLDGRTVAPLADSADTLGLL